MPNLLRSHPARLALVALVLAALPLATAAAERAVAPQTLDARVAAADPAHWLAYDPAEPEQPLLVWLSGTGGKPHPGPQAFFQTVREAGYRLISLSFHTTPAVGQVCVGRALKQDADCAARFRHQRIWGDAPTVWVDDQAQDAIVPRLTLLLRHLAATEPEAGWGRYLDGAALHWPRIVLAGQSQGGGMAAFLAQEREVGGVLMFSGGWDHSAPGTLAPWYRRSRRTPPERWHAFHHIEEGQAAALARIAEWLGVPERNRHALHEPVARNAHGEGIGNPVYRPLWLAALRALKP